MDVSQFIFMNVPSYWTVWVFTIRNNTWVDVPVPELLWKDAIFSLG